MNQQDIARIRLQNQLIASKKDKNILELTRYMGAMQAQDYYSMLWSIGVRTGLTQREIIDELEKIKVLRTWPQRGTIHLIPTNDALWQVELSSERLIRSSQKRKEQLELDESVIKKAEKIFTKTLDDKKLISRPIAMELLENHGISTKSGRGYHILVTLALKGITFIGPMKNKQQTIGLLKDWISKNHISNRPKNLAEITKRYFLSHGPATIDDFSWWSGLTKKDIRLGLEMNQNILKSLTIEGKEYFAGKEMWNADSSTHNAFLLSGFDEFILGYKDRTATLPQKFADKIIPGGNGMFLYTIVINGQVVGTWKRKIKKAKVDISLSPFRKLSKSELTLLEAPIKSYSKFLGLDANVEINSSLFAG